MTGLRKQPRRSDALPLRGFDCCGSRLLADGRIARCLACRGCAWMFVATSPELIGAIEDLHNFLSHETYGQSAARRFNRRRA